MEQMELGGEESPSGDLSKNPAAAVVFCDKCTTWLVLIVGMTISTFNSPHAVISAVAGATTLFLIIQVCNINSNNNAAASAAVVAAAAAAMY